MGWSTIKPEQLAQTVRSTRRTLPQAVKDTRAKVAYYRAKGHKRGERLYLRVLELFEQTPEKFQ
ncbi:MAG: hypothetical protein KAJ55_00445 [Anaerolineales bacterium]|nr:hypothetical protein [Anaerolineales bacterium]